MNFIIFLYFIIPFRKKLTRELKKNNSHKKNIKLDYILSSTNQIIISQRNNTTETNSFPKDLFLIDSENKVDDVEPWKKIW